jgi:FkbM family methyltransferase
VESYVGTDHLPRGKKGSVTMHVASSVHKIVIRGVGFEVFDEEGSEAASLIADELRVDTYGIEEISFCAQDVVIDVRGHIGIFAIYLGLHFPELVIHSLEPFPSNYELFSRNLALNRVGNVTRHPIAISGDGRDLQLVANPTNSGSATCNSTTLSYRRAGSIPSMTLDSVFDKLGVAQCKLLKLDCEGMEYESLLSTQVWPRIGYLRAEFHTNHLLASRGYSVNKLTIHCVQRLGRGKIRIGSCRMSE